jgi:uncharacterized sulfatase
MSELHTGTEPFFFYLHFNGPHGPYYPPNSYYDSFTESIDMPTEEIGEFSLDVYEHFHEYMADGCDFDPVEWSALKAMYDAEVAYVDYCVGEIFDWVQENLTDTIVVITSDHGELFGEYGLLGHRIVLDDHVIRVPLVVHGLNSVQWYPERVVQHVDLVRTLLENIEGSTDKVEGIDIRDRHREYAVSFRGAERYQKNIEEFREHNDQFDPSQFHDGTLISFRTSNYKLLTSESRTELVTVDDETEDISGQHPEETDRLESDLRGWQNALQQFKTHSGEGDASAVENRLSDLGYLT